MVEKIVKLCAQNRITQKDLEEKLGFGRKSLGNWKRHSPLFENVVAVADFFGVSLDWLAGRDVKQEVLSSQEKELLEAFRSMNEQGQLALLSAAEGFANTGIYKKCDLAQEEA